jgi:hypothetical protein
MFNKIPIKFPEKKRPADFEGSYYFLEKHYAKKQFDLQYS